MHVVKKLIVLISDNFFIYLCLVPLQISKLSLPVS